MTMIEKETKTYVVVILDYPHSISVNSIIAVFLHLRFQQHGRDGKGVITIDIAWELEALSIMLMHSRDFEKSALPNEDDLTRRWGEKTVLIAVVVEVSINC